MSVTLTLGTFLMCFVSGFLPWVNAEIVIAATAVAVGSAGCPLLVAAAAVGQMLAKLTIYGLVRRAPGRLPARTRAPLERLGRMAARPRLAAVGVFSGAAVGLPPLYLATLAAGMARLPLALFATAGTLGVLFRYTAVAFGAARLADAVGVSFP